MPDSSNKQIAVVTVSDKLRSVISARLSELNIKPVFLSHDNDSIPGLEAHADLSALLIDLDDPGLADSQVLAYLHKKYPPLKVIVMSADSDPGRIRMCMHNGVFDFLPKPLDTTDFDNTIKQVISKVRELQKNVSDYEEILSIEHELDVARQIQSSIIPEAGPYSAGSSYQISGYNQAAQKVGGDFFDYFALDDNRLGFVIGDVASKGITAAIYMAVSRTLFKSIAVKGYDPATCLKKLNRVLVMESDPSMFIAIFYGVLDLKSGEIEYANGGHTHPVIVRFNGSVQTLDDGSDVVLGVLEDVGYKLYYEKLNPGDIFFMATDGFSELTDAHGKPVSDHFIRRNLIKHRTRQPDQILETIYDSVNQIHPGSQSLADDLTCLLLKYQGSK